MDCGEGVGGGLKGAKREGRRRVMRALQFAGKFLLVLTGIIAALLLFRISFDFSRWVGLLIVGVFTIVLYVTVHRWLRWLPGLLIFGVINSLLVLVTHKAPTNPGLTVSTGVAGLLLAFYAVGCLVAFY